MLGPGAKSSPSNPPAALAVAVNPLMTCISNASPLALVNTRSPSATVPLTSMPTPLRSPIALSTPPWTSAASTVSPPAAEVNVNTVTPSTINAKVSPASPAVAVMKVPDSPEIFGSAPVSPRAAATSRRASLRNIVPAVTAPLPISVTVP